MRLTVGILTHNSEHVVSRCLETVVAQTGLGALTRDWKIVCLDNASNNRIELIRLEKRFRDVRFLREEKNRGFAYGHNGIMRAFPADFHAVLNPDLLLEPNFLAKLVEALEPALRYGSAAGKLLRWDIGSTAERTNIIDSVGIGVTKRHVFFDIGQGEEDRGQFETPEERFGGTGAAVVYRRSALEAVAHEGTSGPEFFDETMFLYKEDIDLAYRLLAGWHSCLYIPDAVAWHARTLRTSKARSQRPAQKRVWSAAHESLIIRKHAAWWPLGIRFFTFTRQLLKWLYLLFFEPYVFFAARKLLKRLKPEALARRRSIKHTVPFERIAHLFH